VVKFCAARCWRLCAIAIDESQDSRELEEINPRAELTCSVQNPNPSPRVGRLGLGLELSIFLPCGPVSGFVFARNALPTSSAQCCEPGLWRQLHWASVTQKTRPLPGTRKVDRDQAETTAAVPAACTTTLFFQGVFCFLSFADCCGPQVATNGRTGGREGPGWRPTLQSVSRRRLAAGRQPGVDTVCYHKEKRLPIGSEMRKYYSSQLPFSWWVL